MDKVSPQETRLPLVLVLVALGLTTLSAPLLAADANQSPVDFDRDIRPIIASNCLACHGPDPEERMAGLRLDTRDGAIEDRKGVRAIVPGQPDKSELLRRITASDPSERMPPAKVNKDGLSQREIDMLRRWINDGAPYAEHWAYVKPVRPALPDIKNKTWPRHAIDHFVLRRLEDKGLAPSPEADRHTWIRRVTLDLTGLPPTIAEVDAFVNDTRADAYEKAVDRLLASPRFGERWARVWLDLARYADSAGYAQDPPRVIWQYRDWVIRAINDNMPFDQFTIQQLAGDLLPPPEGDTPQAEDARNDLLIATAFHRNTMTNSEGGTNDEEFRNAAIVDRVNTTMQVWMGVTMGCAQCHNHKYDPISQEEYFEIFAILNQTEDADRGNEAPTLMTLTDEQVAQRDRLKQQIAELEKIVAQKTLEAKNTNAPRGRPATGPLKTRYVRVELLGKSVFLHLAEVQAFVGNINVAQTGKATQNSTDFGGPPQRANDGNTNGDYEAGSVSHTAQSDNPWWEVDLLDAHPLDRVVVWNRTDGIVGGRLKPFRVVLLDEKRQPVWVRQFDQSPQKDLAIDLPRDAGQLDDKTRLAVAEYTNGNTSPDIPEKKRLDQLKKKLASIKGVPTPIMRELPDDRQRKTHIQIRGSFQNLGREVTAGTPDLFHEPATGDDGRVDRLDLARWLVSKDNPLTARVTVNRYWDHLFGQGLVTTPEDFGVQGERPSDPKLLDWLAVEFMESDWDVKQLIRSIALSATYRQTSRVTPKLLEVDRDNRLLTRGPRFRLSAEMIRDQALAVAGLLSDKMFGPSVKPPQPKLGIRAAFGGSTDWDASPGEDRYRRGLYTFWRRTTPYPSMLTFDATSREVCTIRRVRTNTPLQAFVTLNDPVFVEAAQAMARRIVREGGATTADRVTYAFRLTLGRLPSDQERQRLIDLYNNTESTMRAKPQAAVELATDPLGPLPNGMAAAELAAWTVVGNVLLNLDETLARP